MRRRVIFFEPVSSMAFAEFADGEGWALADSLSAEDGTTEYVWLTGEGIRVHWIDDPVLHRTYVTVFGEDSAVVEGRIRIAFDGYTADEALDEFRAAADWPERVEALSVVAAVAPEAFDDRVFAALAAGLTDENEVVRHQAVLAVFYAPWVEFLPLLGRMAAADPYPEARRVAVIAIETVREGRAPRR